MLELLTEMGGLQLWPGMVELARASCTELDDFRACHIYILWTSVFTRRNKVTVIQTCITQCRIKMNLYEFLTTPQMEKVILIACNGHLGTNGNS